MKKVMSLLMLSCKKASELIDKKSIVSLSFREKMQLTMHTSMCDACSSYQKQSKLIDNFLLRHIQSQPPESIPVIENKELQNLIISRL